jgi:hypothetical protein
VPRRSTNLLDSLPDGHDATEVLACLVELFDRVRAELRRTLTWDPQPLFEGTGVSDSCAIRARRIGDLRARAVSGGC